MKDEFNENGLKYKKVSESAKAYIYKVSADYFNTQYEVFVKNSLDNYPTDESFGKWAWTYPNLNDATVKFKTL